MLLEPFLFQGNEIELISSRKLAIKPILINEIAETSLAGSSFDEFAIPRLWQSAQLVRGNVANVSLMGSVGRGRTKAPEMILQLLFKHGIGPDLARRLGTIFDEIRHMGQRIEHTLDTNMDCFVR